MTITYGGSLGTAWSKAGGTTLSVTGSAPVGSTVIITYSGINSIASITASDNGGNTYVTDYIVSGATVTTAIIRGVITSSFTTITVTQGTSNSGRSVGVDYFTSNGSLKFDVTATGSGSSVSPTATVTGAKGGLFIGLIGINAAAVAPSTAPSWSQLSGYNTGTTGGSVASNASQYAGYLITSSTTGTYNATIPTSRTWQEEIVAYNEAVFVSTTLTDTVTLSDNIATVVPVHAQMTLTDTVTTSENVTVRGPVHAQMTLTDTVTLSETLPTRNVNILEDFEDTNYNFNFTGNWIRTVLFMEEVGHIQTTI
jgi:hypothetical protein